MIALWDTTGNEVVKALSAERRNAGGVASGLALTLVTVVDERHVREAETAVATAAAAHPCRLLVVVRSQSPAAGASTPESRLDAEIVVGGRLGPAEAVVMRMHGRLTQHAESVVIPLLAPDVPVVTWWHDAPPARIATDALGVVAERRITDVARSDDPIKALHQRAEDYAAGDTDLAWTRTTPWRTLLAGALDTVAAPVVAASVTADPRDPTAALLGGWLCSRLGITVAVHEGGHHISEVQLRLGNGEEITVGNGDGTARMRRTGLPERVLPLIRRQLGDQLAEEMRRLTSDQTYAAALEAATGVTGLADRPQTRVHVWQDGAPATVGLPGDQSVGVGVTGGRNG
jgi:glucose-6-phosphate dehydrogenase assembly protein OpcA